MQIYASMKGIILIYCPLGKQTL